MKKWLTALMAAGLLLYPFATTAADYGSQTPQTQQVPPVAQTLVREGDFAVRLAAELRLGNPSDETVAEDMLARAGVVPLNGWISDYPMTPVIIGQLHDAIVQASTQGTLPMDADDATEALTILAAEMNLPTPAGESAQEAEGSPSPAAQQNPAVINNYYYDQGPPIVTYYPPPPYYAYLYAWVPYPTFWFGFWYPGFYISHSFTTVVVVKDHHRDHWKHRVVSNRVIDPVTRKVAVVDPVIRTRDGKHRTATVLRTRNGEQFNNVAEMRKEINKSGFRDRGPGASGHKEIGSRGFRSPEARKSADAIYSRSLENTRMNSIREGKRNPGSEKRYLPPNGTRAGSRGENRYTVPDRARNGSTGERRYGPPTTVREQSMSRGAEKRYRTLNEPARSNRQYRDSERRSYAPGKMLQSSGMTSDIGQGRVPNNTFVGSISPPQSRERYGVSPNSSAPSYKSNTWHGGRNGFRTQGPR